jgi:hypothetical protein
MEGGREEVKICGFSNVRKAVYGLVKMMDVLYVKCLSPQSLTFNRTI